MVLCWFVMEWSEFIKRHIIKTLLQFPSYTVSIFILKVFSLSALTPWITLSMLWERIEAVWFSTRCCTKKTKHRVPWEGQFQALKRHLKRIADGKSCGLSVFNKSGVLCFRCFDQFQELNQHQFIGGQLCGICLFPIWLSCVALIYLFSVVVKKWGILNLVDGDLYPMIEIDGFENNCWWKAMCCVCIY